MDSCQTLLQGILSQSEIRSHDTQTTASYIKEKIRENLSSERTINLFHCLNELNDTSIVEEVQNYLRSGRLSTESLSPAQWSALVFVLLTSEGELDVCNLTENSCKILSSAVSSNSSCLRELDLSHNDLMDSGVNLLSAGLVNPQCNIRLLRLSGCRVTDTGCASLASALRSNPSHLRELDLSNNNTGDSGVRQISTLLKDPTCQLERLRLSGCRVTDKGCAFLASALWSNSSHLRELVLSYNNTGDSTVIQLCGVLKDPKCQLQKLRFAVRQFPCKKICIAILNSMKIFYTLIAPILKNFSPSLYRLSHCNITDTGCASLASALSLNPSHLRELDLSKNNTGDSGVIQLSAVLEDPECQLQILRLGVKLFPFECLIINNIFLTELMKSFSPSLFRLSDCGVTDTGCASLASALRSNPSHLRELDLSGNDTGDSGVIQLSAVLKDPKCQLQILRLGVRLFTSKCV
uniref:NACHT LRR and PYD domain-containing protein n=1 Tax=Paramormyrops kingsleyae TaxID=1676925 RepID=A0A3B3TAY5_9TELE